MSSPVSQVAVGRPSCGTHWHDGGPQVQSSPVAQREKQGVTQDAGARKPTNVAIPNWGTV